MAWDTGLCQTDSVFCFASSEATRIRAVAGPGTGKSFAMKRRIARLIEQGADPQRILAVTFTRTAAADLKREIASLEVPGAEHVVAKTLHSLCFSILNKEEVLTRLGRTPRPMLEHETDPIFQDLSDERFGSVPEKKRRIKAFEAAWARLQADEPGFADDDIDNEFEGALNTWMIAHKSMLIGEIIPKTLAYLQDNPVCPERGLYDHVLVDEYQDLNKAEQVLISLLAGQGTITVVGDDDQSIYSFRNAHPEGIRVFPDNNHGCVSIEFDECRRCPSLVTEMASSLIRNNTGRTLGALSPCNNNDAGDIRILQWHTLQEEIAGVAVIIQTHLRLGLITPGDILVLTPRRKVGYQIRNRLSDAGINVRSYFREDALDSKESRRAFSLLNLAVNPEDRVALRYLLGFGSNDFRRAAYQRLVEAARDNNLTVRVVLDQLVAGELRIPYTKQIVDSYISIQADLAMIHGLLTENPAGIIELLCPYDADLYDDLREAMQVALEKAGECPDEGDSREEWLRKVFDETRESISMPEIPEEVDHVRIMSLHASKGLSAKMVIICTCIDELIPSDMSSLGETELQRRLEEQRRLFYVAITRCKNEPMVYPGTLILSSCRAMDGVEALRLGMPPRPGQIRHLRPSRFLRELGQRQPHSIYGGSYLEQLRI